MDSSGLGRHLNLLGWSPSNVVAVALDKTVYCWNAANGSTSALCTLADEADLVTSVAWATEGSTYLGVGTNSADVQLWDAAAGRQVRRLHSHAGRVGALAWNGAILSSGSRDGYIHNYDVRVRNAHVATLAGHAGEVCGLKYSADGLLASGGNDNRLCIWDIGASAAGAAGDISRDVAPVFTLTEHVAAVKALAWCPWQRNTIASGGGSADRCIKFWNAGTGAALNSIDTGSQVCSLLWSTSGDKELLSSHGFAQNQLCLWKYPTMAKVKELTGHSARVLHMAAGPDGATVVSASADESLRFWRVFSGASKAGKAAAAPASNARMLSAIALR